MKKKYPRFSIILDLRKAHKKRRNKEEVKPEDIETIEIEKDGKVIRIKKGEKP
jgi:hypothetical protein